MCAADISWAERDELSSASWRALASNFQADAMRRAPGGGADETAHQAQRSCRAAIGASPDFLRIGCQAACNTPPDSTPLFLRKRTRNGGDATVPCEVYRLGIVASEPIDWLISALCDCSKVHAPHFRAAANQRCRRPTGERPRCKIAGSLHQRKSYPQKGNRVDRLFSSRLPTPATSARFSRVLCDPSDLQSRPRPGVQAERLCAAFRPTTHAVDRPANVVCRGRL